MKKLLLLTALVTPLFVTMVASANQQTPPADVAPTVTDYHQSLVQPTKGIGAREAGSKEEQHAAEIIYDAFNQLGYHTQKQTFTFGEKKQSSSNIIADTHSSTKPTIILAAHYDSTAANAGSLGATDNGAGVAAMLAIAAKLSTHKAPNFNIRYIAFGAEEIGLHGSKHYVNQLAATEPQALSNVVAMINFDTIAGGDYIYVHSADTKPYDCDGDNSRYSSVSWLRDQLLLTSKTVLGEAHQYRIHPASDDLAQGVTGPWSDHAPFACKGIPVAYVESTNFHINGRDGYDGYSQSTHPKLWDCFDNKTNSACDRNTESKWGNIWHTEYDNLTKLDVLFPGRINQQLEQSVQVLVEMLTHFSLPKQQ
ncbi:M28 family metallopeptidase [Thalassotalea fusca]